MMTKIVKKKPQSISKQRKNKKFDILKTFEKFNRENLGVFANRMVEIILVEADNIFSKNISLTRIDSMDGQIIARYDIYEGGISIKTLNDTIQIVANLPPFITEINMPDTIVRPRIGTKDLLISLSVDDPNGIQDVINAYFQVKNNSTGQWSSDYPMNDMGTLGDATAGDGVFSTGLEISSDNSAVTNYFRFRIKDTASNFSDWSLDSVVVR